jgi:hypothetical protein
LNRQSPWEWDTILPNASESEQGRCSSESASRVQLAGYDAFEHLRRSLFWDGDSRLLVVTAHGDETGADVRDEIYAVAVYSSTVRQWEAFSKLWGQMLFEFRIPYYHASELEAFWKSDIYKNVITDRETLVRLQSKAFSLIKTYTQKGIAVAVIKKDFINVMRPVQGENELYSFCAQECMRGMKFWLSYERRQSGIVNYIFEYGAQGWGIFERHTSSPEGRKRSKVGTITRAEKCLLFPLQAADALAFEAYKEMVNGILYRERSVPRVRRLRKSVGSAVPV